MSKWHGYIGYIHQEETAPEVYIPSVIEREKSGELLKNRQQITSGYGANPDVRVQNQISIVADQFDRTNLQDLRYLIWDSQYWAVESAIVEPPRLIVTLGGVWNGKRGTSSTS